MKHFRLMLLAAAAFLASCAGKPAQEQADPLATKVVVAYVTSWTDVMPDPALVTHINYAFGHVNDTFNGVRVDNKDRLRAIVALKKQKPSLQVLLSVGGWGSGRFSEMADDEACRLAFAADCARVVREFGLDGIDIDWEYPTQNSAGISSSPRDTDNFTLLMRDLRQALGPDKALTLATVCSAKYMDFKAFLPYVDFVNIMAYDMGGQQGHHASLYPSEHSGSMTSHEAVQAHIRAGVPPSKLVMGMPFYGKGREGYREYADSVAQGLTPQRYVEHWDSIGLFPYLLDEAGRYVYAYENPRSISAKCQYILDHDLLGGMYWEYEGGMGPDSLCRVVADALLGKPHKQKVLVLTERGGQHGSFTDAGLAWLQDEGKQMGFSLTEINNAEPITREFLHPFSLIIQLDFPPYTWPKEAEEAFIDYIDRDGHGGWIGFHHATLLGEFDGYPLWQWFSDFMGGIRYQNYIAALADGTVRVEDAQHPVMQGVPASFVIPGDEWYTYDKSPRPNVRVLATVDESTYTPASDIRMGDDHPVVWVNEAKAARNVYFQMGHSGQLYDVEAFTTMFRNAIRWTLGK